MSVKELTDINITFTIPLWVVITIIWSQLGLVLFTQLKKPEKNTDMILQLIILGPLTLIGIPIAVIEKMYKKSKNRNRESGKPDLTTATDANNKKFVK